MINIFILIYKKNMLHCSKKIKLFLEIKFLNLKINIFLTIKIFRKKNFKDFEKL